MRISDWSSDVCSSDLLPTESGLFLASDVDLLVAFAGYAPVIDWPVLAQHLAAPDLPRRRTCLEGLDELGGGERLSDVAGCRTIDTPWSIWDFAAPDKRLTDGREAILRVRDAVQTAVAAGASAYETVVLRLSRS